MKQQDMLLEHDNNMSESKVFIICPHGLGDTMIVCGYKDALESKYNVPVHFIIKPTHIAIMKMYGIDDYSIKTFDNDELFKIGEKNPEIKIGECFVAHHDFIPNGKKILEDFANLKISFIDVFRLVLGLDKDARFKYPMNAPKITNDLKNKLESIAPLNKIILISPESFSTKRIIPDIFENEVKTLKKKGFTVISNVIEKQKTIKGSIYLPLTLEDALAIGINCAGVITVRSGFTDIILPFLDKIIIYYPDKTTFDFYSLQQYYTNKDIKEIIAPDAKLKKIGPFFQYEQKAHEELFRFCITIYRKKMGYDSIKYCILGIPILGVKIHKFYKKYYLFDLIPIFKEDL